MDTAKNVDDHMTSASAFFDGGVQEACDDACSICLEDFSQSDPSTATNCNHDFHLQCILEWCQRSSNCPMCWQPISLKDATSQTLLEAVEQERITKSYRSRTPTVYHHPFLRDFDLQHLNSGDNEIDLEEHIFRHLAAAAAMRRGHHYFLGEGQRNRSSSQASRQLFTFEAPSASQSTAVSSSVSSVGAESESAVSVGSASMPYPVSPDAPVLLTSGVQMDQFSISRDGYTVPMANRQRMLSETRSFVSPALRSQETAAPSELQSLAESVRSRFSTWSTRYRESFSRNTRGWKERLFARSTSIADIGSEVRREVNDGIGSVSRMMERFDSRGNNGAGHDSRSSFAASRSNMEGAGNDVTHVNDSKMPASCGTSSASD